MVGARITWWYRTFTSLAVMAAFLSMTGCAATMRLHGKNAEVEVATAENPADRVICIWEPAEGQGLDGVPSRGFAGQIIFFARSGPSPVKVDGNVRIYVYDDVGTPEEQAKPIHQFDFEGDAWTQHLQMSTLGAAYNVFVPYTRKNSYQTSCAVRLRFTPREGPPIYSDMVSITLPGAVNPNKQKTEKSAAIPLLSKPPVEPPKLGASITNQQIPLADTTIPLPESVAVLTRGPRPSIPRAPSSRIPREATPNATTTRSTMGRSAMPAGTIEGDSSTAGNQSASLSSAGSRSSFTGRRSPWKQPGNSITESATNRGGFVGLKY